jgi:hypothetical protein
MALTTVSSLSEAFSSGMPVTVDEINFAKEKTLVALTAGDGGKDSLMDDVEVQPGVGEGAEDAVKSTLERNASAEPAGSSSEDVKA